MLSLHQEIQTKRFQKNILNVLRDQKIDLIEIGFLSPILWLMVQLFQKSSQRAIKAGANIDSTLQLVKNFRKNDKNIPIVLMGYFNPIFQYGLKDFFLNCSSVGVDGLIIVDLPPEEDHYINTYTKKYNVHNIRLLTPTYT